MSSQQMKNKLPWQENTFLFFAVVFTYQLLIIFQGLDLMDEGFHVSFYQQFFNDPQSVIYGFGYWLTGLVGALYMKAFPNLGLWGIRLAGVIITTITMGITFRLLKDIIPKGILKLSIIIIILSLNTDPKNFYYNNFSAFIYIAASYFIYHGLTKNKQLLLVIAGFFIGINIFTRIPNLLGLGISVIFLYHGFINDVKFIKQLKSFFFFYLGSIIGITAVVLLMASLNHLALFEESIKLLFSISNQEKINDGVQGGYGILNLISLSVKQFITSISSALITISAALIIYYVLEITKNKKSLVKYGARTILIFSSLFFLISSILNGFSYLNILFFIIGICLISALIVLTSAKSNNIKLLMALGSYILIVHPLGSFVGIVMVAPYSLWIILPLTIFFISKWQIFNIESGFSAKELFPPHHLLLNQTKINYLKFIGLGLVMMASIYQVIIHPYLEDGHSRLKMKYGINNKLIHHIYTSKGRAEVINELLSASSNYIKPNDVVFAYDCVPMYHYLTETRAYIRNPCPWYYTTYTFKFELENAQINNKILPVVVMQKIRTIGFDSNQWPEIIANEDYSLVKRSIGRNEIFAEFLSKNKYEIIWENSVFRILKPGNQFK